MSTLTSREVVIKALNDAWDEVPEWRGTPRTYDIVADLKPEFPHVVVTQVGGLSETAFEGQMRISDAFRLSFRGTAWEEAERCRLKAIQHLRTSGRLLREGEINDLTEGKETQFVNQRGAVTTGTQISRSAKVYHRVQDVDITP